MKPITIYLIDDDPAILALLTEIIEPLGMTVESYTEAKLFFKKVASFENNAILILDLLIPEMDGIEVMERLGEMKNPPSVILISGRGSNLLHSAEKLGHLYKLDILAYLNKPEMTEKLQQLLEQHIANINKQ